MSPGIYLQMHAESLTASPRYSAPTTTIHKARYPEPAFWSVSQTLFLAHPAGDMMKAPSYRSVAQRSSTSRWHRANSNTIQRNYTTREVLMKREREEERERKQWP
ncbi:hypothetical protein K503DRAFT_787417 [Rhizopogon vinicolor AM-OR11-026]|uniref:Uncharacterized protein n=1 Tax=Rhizopogon vinicolor AM-OR11-026 TaxID=1314800 RepID=A0A1B7MHN1_9AGAM|nr:hypothetical protein K503DRAFT_787417 [Rhizopogon vinicolor AM-OR11-026]